MKKSKLWGEIQGEKRQRDYFLANWEDNLINYLYPLVPKWIKTYHLTLSGLIWTLMAIGFGFLARENYLWLLGMSLVLELHYITDMLDGVVGRKRKEGLVRWGFYADHFLDLLFGLVIVLSYMIAILELKYIGFGLLITTSLLFFDTVAFALVSEEYKTSGFGILKKIGPTELIHAWAIINVIIVILGEGFILFFLGLLILEVIVVIIQFYLHQKRLWELDKGKKGFT